VQFDMESQAGSDAPPVFEHSRPAVITAKKNATRTLLLAISAMVMVAVLLLLPP
jgi:hypothetical protein